MPDKPNNPKAWSTTSRPATCFAPTTLTTSRAIGGSQRIISFILIARELVSVPSPHTTQSYCPSLHTRSPHIIPIFIPPQSSYAPILIPPQSFYRPQSNRPSPRSTFIFIFHQFGSVPAFLASGLDATRAVFKLFLL